MHFCCCNKIPRPKQFKEEGLILACGSGGITSIVEKKAWHGGRNRKLDNQIFIHPGSPEGVGKWVKAINPQSLSSVPSNILPPWRLLPKDSITSPTVLPMGGDTSVQKQEPMADSSHSSRHLRDGLEMIANASMILPSTVVVSDQAHVGLSLAFWCCILLPLVVFLTSL